MIQTDAIGDKYDMLIDRESAEEILAAKGAQAAAAAVEAGQRLVAQISDLITDQPSEPPS